jgi:general secretion pathway protein K
MTAVRAVDMAPVHRFTERGMALLLVVATISVLSVVVISFGQRTRSSMTQAFYYRDGALLQSMAESGVDIGISVLYDDRLSNRYDALVEPWSRLADVDLAPLFEQGSLRLRIDDLSGRIPINRLVPFAEQETEKRSAEAFRTVLVRLLSDGEFAVEDEQQARIIVDSITDWLDTDETPLPFGAETDYYLSLENPYPAKNGALETVDELLQVRGITPEILYGSDEKSGLSEYITIYGRGKINVNTAPLLLFKALAPGISEDVLEMVEDFRTDAESAPLLAEPGWHQTLIGWPQDAVIDQRLITTRSTYFSVSAAARMKSSRQQLTAVVGRSDSSLTILYRSMK